MKTNKKQVSGSYNEQQVLERAKVMVQRINEFLTRGNNAEAINHFNKALNYMEAHKDEIIKNKAQISDLYNDLAIALIKVNRENDAIKIFDKALHINPNNVELVNEAKWFITVASELKLQASSKSKSLSAQISLAVQWYLTPTAN